MEQMDLDDMYILTVDDDPNQASLSNDVLGMHGFDVDMETDPIEALELIKDNTYDGVVSDYDMPQMNGLELLEEVREVNPELPFILYTGRGSEEIASQAISKGVTDYVRKGDGMEDFDQIATTLEEEIEENRATIFEKALADKGIPIEIIEDSLMETDHSFMITDKQGRIKYVNDAVAETSGYEKDEILGERPSKFKSGRHTDEFYNELWTTILNDNVWGGKIVNETKNGEEYTINQTITPVEFGNETYFVAINKQI